MHWTASGSHFPCPPSCCHAAEGPFFLLQRVGNGLVDNRNPRLPSVTAIVDNGFMVHAEGGEVGVECESFKFFDRMLCESDTEYQMNSWFICGDWRGKPVASEAEEIFYLGGDELDRLSLPNDRKVVTRLFREEIQK